MELRQGYEKRQIMNWKREFKAWVLAKEKEIHNNKIYIITLEQIWETFQRQKSHPKNCLNDITFEKFVEQYKKRNYRIY